MSWSASTSEPIEKGEIFSLEGTPQTNPDGVEAAYLDAISAARVAADVLAGAVGGPDDLIHISASGHANPDHQPADGWADESITVTVSHRRRVEPSPAEGGG